MRKKIAESLKKFASVLGIPALAATIMSTVVTVSYQILMENSKQRAVIVAQHKQQFDASQSNIIVQLGLYTDSIVPYLKNDTDRPQAELKIKTVNKEDLRKAIIAAQYQLNRLNGELRVGEAPSLTAYATELDKLSNAVRRLDTAPDLGAIYKSTQRMLELHDEVSGQLQASVKISAFDWLRF